jgi:hypothetical protein
MAYSDGNPDYTEKRIPADTDEAALAEIKTEYEKNGWRWESTSHSPGTYYAPEELVLHFRRIISSVPLA